MASGALHRLGESIRRTVVGEAPCRAYGPPIERLASDLHRLGGMADQLHADRHVYARVFRLRAIEQAYDDTLLAACGALGMPVRGLHSPLGDLERMTLELELARRGLLW